VESAGVRWSPPDSTGVCWSPVESAGVHWNPVESSGLQWTLADSMESSGFRRSSMESSGEVCWSPPDRVWSDSGDSTGIRENPLESTGLDLDWTCQFGPCHTNKIQDLSPADSSGIRLIPADSGRTGGGVYSPRADGGGRSSSSLVVYL
jgi:hypothetical protein